MSKVVAEPLQLAGSAGQLEAVADIPAADAAPAAFMVICHPHPLHGGTMTNKVVTTLARAAHELAVPTLRFNYRGVGASSGSFDNGKGETDDAIAAIAWGRERWPGAALWLGGFSFGGVVALRASTAAVTGEVARLVTVAPALASHFSSFRDIQVPACPWLIVQGDADEVIDGAAVIEWAAQLRPQPHLRVLPGVGHYFHGQLNALQQQVLPFLQAP